MIGWLALATIALSQAQTPAAVTGRVVRVVSGDTVAAVGARVVLHAVTPEKQGPLDSVMSDHDGAYRISATSDTGAVLLVSARWQGVEYFAPPFSDTTIPVTVVVVDTSSSQPVVVAARHLILGGPAPDGARDVVDLVVLRNAGATTRVGGDSLAATWTMLLPPNVANMTVGDADFSPAAFDLHGDSLLLHAPIPPGERQFFLMYQVAPGALDLKVPLIPPPDTLSLLSEERDLATNGGLTGQGDETVAGRMFHRLAGGSMLQDTLVITLSGRPGIPKWFLPAALVLFTLVLMVVTGRVLLPRHNRPGSFTDVDQRTA